MNKLLLRQITKYLGDTDSIPKNVEQLLEAVNDAYNNFDSDSSLMERAFDLSSQEFSKVNKQLKIEFDDRRHAEEALKNEHKQFLSILDSIDEPIYVVDRDSYELIYINNALKKIWTGKIGQKCYKSINGLDSPCPFCSNGQIFGDYFGREYIWEFRSNINERYYRCIDKAIKWPDGRMVHYTMAFDITDQKQLEEEIIKRKNHESISILAGGIAHDFNNLLTVILGNISLSLLDINDEALVRSLRNAEKASINAKSLSYQLLTFSKGGAPIKKAASVKEIIEESASFSSKGSNTKCKFNISDNLFTVEIDSGQISQVINNLVINADHAMPEGGTITITCENYVIEKDSGIPLSNGKYVKISIEDCGAGISEEYIGKIFDPYFTTKDKGDDKGSGLGLAICYSIIKKHHGLITVESEMNKCTTFYIYLPASVKKIDKILKLEETFITGKGRILIMDDEEFVRALFEDMLRRLGYEAESAKNGTEAIKSYKKSLKSDNTFDAVIMDLVIPGNMGGKETIEKLRKIDPDVKAIVTSGYSNDPIMANFKEYGFSAVVSKPLNVHDLSKILHNVINN